MSEEQRGTERARGAFDNMLDDMRRRLDREGRSPEYIAAFFDNLRNVAFDYASYGE
jgi:hypothetical protein